VSSVYGALKYSTISQARMHQPAPEDVDKGEHLRGKQKVKIFFMEVDEEEL
jgi:hypothetical protein